MAHDNMTANPCWAVEGKHDRWPEHVPAYLRASLPSSTDTQKAACQRPTGWCCIWQLKLCVLQKSTSASLLPDKAEEEPTVSTQSSLHDETANAGCDTTSLTLRLALACNEVPLQ